MINEALSEADGQKSMSRMILLAGVSLIGSVFVIVVMGLFWDKWPWTRFDGALTWGRDFVFVTTLPYIGNVASKAIGSVKNGNVDH